MKTFVISFLTTICLGFSFSQTVISKRNIESKQSIFPRNQKVTKGETNTVQKNTIFSEDFNAWPLVGWTIQSSAQSTVTLGTQRWHAIEEANGYSCGIFYENSWAFHHEELISPTIDLPQGNYYLAFDFNTSLHWHSLSMGGEYDNADIFVQASIDNGTTWSDVIWQEDSIDLLVSSFSAGWENYMWKRAFVDISNFSGNSVKFRFTYLGQDAAEFALDNVSIESIQNSDLLLSGTRFHSNSNRRLEYHQVPTSQMNYPGHFINGKIQNLGTSETTSYLEVIDDLGMNYSSAPYTLGQGSSFTFSTAEALQLPNSIGTYNYAVVAEIEMGEDANLTNNSSTLTIQRTMFDYARDNGVVKDFVGGISGEVYGAPLMIGNLFEVYSSMAITGVQVRLADQPDAVGKQIGGQIERYVASSFDYALIGQTETKIITEDDLDGFVSLRILNGPLIVDAGSELLVLAKHFGGDVEVEFCLAQATTQGSVLGRTTDGDLFVLTDPSVVMVRISEDPTLGMENVVSSESTMVFPNPSSGSFTVQFDSADKRELVVRDLNGKVIHTTQFVDRFCDLNLQVPAGVYILEVNSTTIKSTDKLIVH